jgi:nicotinate-nucleotide--dimethylbenzimidazole phosphoribosyltransferase
MAVVLDGLATSVAALVAARLEPAASAHLVAGQLSSERGHRDVLDELGLEPLLDARLRTGEGAGASLATALLRAALATREHTARVSPRRDVGVSGTS